MCMQRTLTFYCEDGVNTNTGAPNYQPFGRGRTGGDYRFVSAAGPDQ